MEGLRKLGEKTAGGESSKKGTEGEKFKKKNAFKYFAIEKAREKVVGAGKALRVQEAH